MADSNLLAKLPSILDAHAKWRRGEKGGARADLARADLAGADLADAYLAGADLADAYLAGAYLADAYLAGADLARANLAGADLADANLARANLAGADLARADLAGADLAGANLARANLAGAYLARADLAGARGLDSAKGLNPLPFGPVTLPDGAFRAYKAGRGPTGGRVIITLEIPEDAQRVAPLVGRKCRASKAKVIALSLGESAESWHTPPRDEGATPITYRISETVEAHKYDPSPFVECSGGIHFFVSRREAEEYGQ